MDILYYLSALCLLLFMVLATYNGFYLHIWKYNYLKEKRAHLNIKHTLLEQFCFPLIVWLLFINTDTNSF
jgi:hypothetical protein